MMGAVRKRHGRSVRVLKKGAVGTRCSVIVIDRQHMDVLATKGHPCARKRLVGRASSDILPSGGGTLGESDRASLADLEGIVYPATGLIRASELYDASQGYHAERSGKT